MHTLARVLCIIRARMHTTSQYLKRNEMAQLFTALGRYSCMHWPESSLLLQECIHKLQHDVWILLARVLTLSAYQLEQYAEYGVVLLQLATVSILANLVPSRKYSNNPTTRVERDRPTQQDAKSYGYYSTLEQQFLCIRLVIQQQYCMYIMHTTLSTLHRVV